jgi:hypothetical protein
VFKSPENENHADKKLLSDKQIKLKEFCVSWNKLQKNLPRESFKIFFLKNVVLYEKYIVKNREWRILMSIDELLARCTCNMIFFSHELKLLLF